MTDISSTVTIRIRSQSFAYINNMSAYQVRQLAGAYAPTSGFTTLQSVTPSEWMNATNPTYGFEPWNIIDYWSGGIGDEANNRLYMVGGGHTDASNNGLYLYDFNGSVPIGPSIVTGSQSTIAQVPTATSMFYVYNDGKAASRHTYDGVAWVNSKFYMIGGSHWKNGGWGSGSTTDMWRFSGGTWTQMTSPPTGIGVGDEVPYCIADPVSGKILLTSRRFNMSQCAFYNTNTETWGTLKATGGNSDLAGYITLAYDSTRSRIAAFGDNCTELWTINWTSETVTRSTHAVSSIMGQSGITPLYDSSRDVYWLFGGYGNSPGWTNIYSVHPTTFAVTSNTLTGDTIPVRGGGGNWPNGSYKRAVFLANKSAIGIVSHFSQPATVIKLP